MNVLRVKEVLPPKSINLREVGVQEGLLHLLIRLTPDIFLSRI